VRGGLAPGRTSGSRVRYRGRRLGEGGAATSFLVSSWAFHIARTVASRRGAQATVPRLLEPGRLSETLARSHRRAPGATCPVRTAAALLARASARCWENAQHPSPRCASRFEVNDLSIADPDARVGARIGDSDSWFRERLLPVEDPSVRLTSWKLERSSEASSCLGLFPNNRKALDESPQGIAWDLACGRGARGVRLELPVPMLAALGNLLGR
jgi:hypothetical protein